MRRSGVRLSSPAPYFRPGLSKVIRDFFLFQLFMMLRHPRSSIGVQLNPCFYDGWYDGERVLRFFSHHKMPKLVKELTVLAIKRLPEGTWALGGVKGFYLRKTRGTGFYFLRWWIIKSSAKLLNKRLQPGTSNWDVFWVWSSEHWIVSELLPEKFYRYSLLLGKSP